MFASWCASNMQWLPDWLPARTVQG
jgi:hypothetical protein